MNHNTSPKNPEVVGTRLKGAIAKEMKLALLNTTIATTDGVFNVETISLDRAQRLAYHNRHILDSAIGHESTAQIMSELLEVEVPVNRQMLVQEPGQSALVFKLKGRPPEGKVLSREEIEAIGYEFKLMTRLSDSRVYMADEQDLGQPIIRVGKPVF